VLGGIEVTTLTITRSDGSERTIHMNDQEVENMISCWTFPNRYLGPVGAEFYHQLVALLACGREQVAS
jgi:hypothetical protein